MGFRRIAGFVLPFVIGAVIVGGAGWLHNRQQDACAYTLLNPHRCGEDLRFSNPDYKPTESALLEDIAEWKTKGVTSVAVSFRDLRNGPSVTIDPGDAYLAMSLYKLPILIRYLKDSEGDAAMLDARLPGQPIAGYRNKEEPDDRVIAAGQSYSVRFLLENLVWYSDNAAWGMLVDRYREGHPEYDIIVDTLAELGILDPQTQSDPRLVSLKSVSSLFRILYNASYLNLAQSQYALELLSRSVFDDGIVAGVPAPIFVANKYGINTDQEDTQLHDCGIVYYPDHPYILCVMTKGKDIATLSQVISSISKTFYDELEQRYSM